VIVHPIEHLRYVARASGVAPASLASEAATALGGLRADPANLVVACRRIVERHPEVGQLWWLCAHLLVSADPSRLAWELADRLGDDPVADVLARELAAEATVVVTGNPSVIADGLVCRTDLTVWYVDSQFGGGDLIRRLDRNEVSCEPIASEALGRAVANADVILIEATAVSPQRVLSPVGSQVLAAVAHAAGTPVWLVAGTGTRLPAPYVDEIARRVLSDGWTGGVDEVAFDLVDRVVTEDGSTPGVAHAVRADCPFAPELLRSGVT
jgi:hypothetical protein